MKTGLIAFVCMSAVILSGCATSTTTASNPNSTRPIRTTEKTVYSKEELDKRGRQTPGEALAAEDASITLTGRH